MEEVATKHDKIPTVSETGMRVTTSLGDGKNYGGIASYGNQRLNWFSEVGEVLSAFITAVKRYLPIEPILPEFAATKEAS